MGKPSPNNLRRIGEVKHEENEELRAPRSCYLQGFLKIIAAEEVVVMVVKLQSDCAGDKDNLAILIAKSTPADFPSEGVAIREASWLRQTTAGGSSSQLHRLPSALKDVAFFRPRCRRRLEVTNEEMDSHDVAVGQVRNQSAGPDRRPLRTRDQQWRSLARSKGEDACRCVRCCATATKCQMAKLKTTGHSSSAALCNKVVLYGVQKSRREMEVDVDCGSRLLTACRGSHLGCHCSCRGAERLWLLCWCFFSLSTVSREVLV